MAIRRSRPRSSPRAGPGRRPRRRLGRRPRRWYRPTVSTTRRRRGKARLRSSTISPGALSSRSIGPRLPTPPTAASRTARSRSAMRASASGRRSSPIMSFSRSATTAAASRPSPWTSYEGRNPCGDGIDNREKTIASFEPFADFNQPSFAVGVPANPLVGMNGAYTRYEIHFNEAEFSAFAANGWSQGAEPARREVIPRIFRPARSRSRRRGCP